MRKIFLLTFSFLLFNYSFSQIPKTAIVEHFTNTRCGICANKNPGMYEVLESYPDAIHIAYHPSLPYSNCIFSQHNPLENDERAQFYGVFGGTPRVVLNGNAIPIQTPLINEEQMDAATDEMSDYSITVMQMELSEGEMNVKVKVQKITNNAVENMDLFVGLAEREIYYNAPNGEDVHYDVFRLKLGEESILNMGLNDIVEFNYTYSFDNEWQADEMFAYAILNNESNYVLQSSKSLLAGEQTGVNEDLVKEGLLKTYPNPATNKVFISNSSELTFNEISIYDLYGKLVLSDYFKQQIEVGYLDSGIYILELRTEKGEYQYLRFQKH